MTTNVVETLTALSSKRLNGNSLASLENDAISHNIHANDIQQDV